MGSCGRSYKERQLSRRGGRCRCNRSRWSSRRWIKLGSGEETGQIKGEVARRGRGGVVRCIRGSHSQIGINDGGRRNSRWTRRGGQSAASFDFL